MNSIRHSARALKMKGNRLMKLRSRIAEADLRASKVRIQRDLVEIQLAKVKEDLGLPAAGADTAGAITAGNRSALSIVTNRYAIGAMIAISALHLRAKRRSATVGQVEELRQLIQDKVIQKQARATKGSAGEENSESADTSVGSFVETVAARVIAHAVISHVGPMLGDGAEQSAVHDLAESS